MEKNKVVFVNFVWKRFIAAKELRGKSIRTLGGSVDKGGVGCSEKTIRRAKKVGKINAHYLEAIAKSLDVSPDYLNGKYDEEFGKWFPEPHNEEIQLFLESMLMPERFPYHLKYDQREKFRMYLESILIMHDISTRQYHEMSEEKQREFMLDIESAVCPVIKRYFTHDAQNREGIPYLESLLAEILCYDPNEPEISEDDLQFTLDYDNRFSQKYKSICNK